MQTHTRSANPKHEEKSSITTPTRPCRHGFQYSSHLGSKREPDKERDNMYHILPTMMEQGKLLKNTKPQGIFLGPGNLWISGLMLPHTQTSIWNVPKKGRLDERMGRLIDWVKSMLCAECVSVCVSASITQTLLLSWRLLLYRLVAQSYQTLR